MNSKLFWAASLLAMTKSVVAIDWHYLTFFPNGGQQFSRLAGSMSVPAHSSLTGNGPYYLWPGLQPTDNSGVYHNVLDSRSGWWFGTGWCCSNPSLPWGGGETISDGETVNFNNYRLGGTWTSTTGHSGGSNTATNTFALADKNFNQAVFAVEIYDGGWTFGSLTFTNVIIETIGGTDASWCNSNPANYNGGTQFSVQGIRSSIISTEGNAGVRCTIDRLVLQDLMVLHKWGLLQGQTLLEDTLGD